MRPHEEEMNMNLTDLLKGYEEKWVVLSPDNTRIIASGDTFDSIIGALRNGFAFKVPPTVALIPRT